jgi:hypothetical protein
LVAAHTGEALWDDGAVEFSLDLGTAVLSRTPAVLRALLTGIPEEWTFNNEGPETWSPYQVVGHMTHPEECDWMDRTVTILADDGPREFADVDREAGFAKFEGWPMTDLLEHFTDVRTSNLERLQALVSLKDLDRIGLHPVFGEVTLRQLLATWVVHDFNHLDQIAKTMAKQFSSAVGLWREFLPIVDAP